MKILIERLPNAKDLPLPSYQSQGAAGMDVLAAEPCCIKPFERQAVATGLKIAIPAGYEVQVRPRSGLALKQGLTILNAPGTIDSDYRGEIKIILINLGQEDINITRGDRIAQLILAPVLQIEWQETDILPETPRGTSGFGSTGI